LPPSAVWALARRSAKSSSTVKPLKRSFSIIRLALPSARETRLMSKKRGSRSLTLTSTSPGWRGESPATPAREPFGVSARLSPDSSSAANTWKFSSPPWSWA